MRLAEGQKTCYYGQLRTNGPLKNESQDILTHWHGSPLRSYVKE